MENGQLKNGRDVSSLVDQVKYHIITPGSLQSRHTQDRVYDFWKELWGEVFGQVGRAEDLNPDEFFRQNIIATLLFRDEVVGFHLYTYFDLHWKPALEHSYFHGVQESSFETLRKKGINKVMSMEYLSISPLWRRSSTQAAFGDALIALALRILPFTPCQAVIGTARTDIKIDDACVRLGCLLADQSPIEKYNYACRLIYCPIDNVRPHPDEKTRKLIDRLWNSRIDEIGITLKPVKKIKTAA